MNVHQLLRRFKSVIRYGLEYGFSATFKLLWRRLSHATSWRTILKTDVLASYSFVRVPPALPALGAGQVSGNTINWVIPPFGRGSGGHLNIFRFISNLEKLGFECRVVIVGGPQPISTDQAAKEIASWFFPLAARVFLAGDNVPAASFTIATEWRTAYWVRSFPKTVHRCYFVQDFEPWFFPRGSEYTFAEETYRFGFVGITAGTWLKEKLSSEYGMQAYAVSFSYDREIYRRLPVHRDETRRVFFYARPVTPRRAFELGLLVLDEVVRRMPGIEVVFAGWDISSYVIPFKHRNAGLLSLNELPGLYNECDAALILSLSNLSLLPLELMACGTPIVSNRAPWTEWLLNQSNSRLAAATVGDLADALCSVLGDEGEANRLREGGFATIATTDWSTEARKMADILRNLDHTTQQINAAFHGEER